MVGLAVVEVDPGPVATYPAQLELTSVWLARAARACTTRTVPPALPRSTDRTTAAAEPATIASLALVLGPQPLRAFIVIRSIGEEHTNPTRTSERAVPGAHHRLSTVAP